MTLHDGQLDQLKASYPHVTGPWLDLSTGLAPFPYEAQIDFKSLTRLPSAADIRACHQAMATSFGEAPDKVLPVPGIELVIRLLPHLLAGPLFVESPIYGDYEHTWQTYGMTKAKTHAETGAIHVVCQPNNPTGAHLSLRELAAFQAFAKQREGWLVVDEAFIEASRAVSSGHLGTKDNLVTFRSFGKFFGLPGVRLGAVIGPPVLLSHLRQLLGGWSVNGIALQLGTLAYQDTAWQKLQKIRLQEMMSLQLKAIQTLKLHIVGSTDLFVTIQAESARHLWRALMNQGIYTRVFEAHNLLRFGLARNMEELNRLTTALRFYCDRNTSNH
jgi:cobalamin biosynthetic protein CobC